MPLILSASLIMFVDCTETESAVNRINEESNDIAGHFSAQVVPQAPVQVTEEPTKLNVIALNVDKGKSLKNNENAVGVSKSAGKVEEHSETTVKPLLTVNETLSVIPKKIKDDILQSGALMRGFFVFLGLSMMIILYLFFRSYRSVDIYYAHKLDKGN